MRVLCWLSNIIDTCLGGRNQILNEIILAVALQKTPPKQSSIQSIQIVKEVDKPNFDIEVIEPLRAIQKAEADKLAAEEAERLRQAEIASTVVSKPTYAVTYSQPTAYTGGFIGSIGHLAAGNNCVDFARQFGKVQSGNPISWSVTTRTPFIGAGVLFYFNHVGIVTGYGDGFVEVAHANAPGAPTRYPMSQIRGFF